MKKNVKTLTLNKQTIAELDSKKILGGLPRPSKKSECHECQTTTISVCPEGTRYY